MSQQYTLNWLLEKIKELFSLKEDTDFKETENSLRKNVSFKSANAWALIFAIFIASVGLNTNSTAVIIGAMLISPLMGPINAAGYALGVHDFTLLKTATRNLAIAVILSLVTSTLYFLISPFSEAQSEILARTSPTFYDVLIASFGGAAGIVALSRNEKGNAIPGVAIATALMPPLCTTGYGIANLDFNIIFGSLYLFVINSVFIGLSSYLFIRYLGFPKYAEKNLKEQIKIDRIIAIVASIIIIPSLFTAWLLLNESQFTQKTKKFIEEEFPFEGSMIVDKKILYSLKAPTINLTLMGETLSDQKISLLKQRMHTHGLENVQLEVKQFSIEERLKANLLKQQQSKESTADLYQRRVIDLEKKLQQYNEMKDHSLQVTKEVKSFDSSLKLLYFQDDAIHLVWEKRINKTQKQKVENFLKARTSQENIVFIHTQML